MADAADSKSAASNGVWVQVPPAAPQNAGANKKFARARHSANRDFLFSPAEPPFASLGSPLDSPGAGMGFANFHEQAQPLPHENLTPKFYLIISFCHSIFESYLGQTKNLRVVCLFSCFGESSRLDSFAFNMIYLYICIKLKN